MRLILERRTERSLAVAIISPLIAIALSLVTIAILFALLGKSPLYSIKVYFLDPLIDSYSSFRENDRKTPTGLTGYLRERGLERVTLCGLATDFCVYFSAIDAREAGFEAAIVLEASRAIDVDGSLARALDAMRAAGVSFVSPDLD